MFTFIVSGLLLTHVVFYSYGSICLWLLQTYSQIQMYLQPPKKMVHNVEDGLECLVEDRIMKYTVTNALDKINDSELGVLISEKNMVLFYPPIDSYVPDYEESNVKFISVSISIYPDLSVHQDIKLKTADYSFYVVGNELNVDFVRYYFLRFKNMYLSPDVEYIMTIVDDNVEFHSVDQNECVAFEKDDYQIFTYKEQEVIAEELPEELLNESVTDAYINSDPVLYTSLPTDDCDLDINQLIQIEEDMMNETLNNEVDILLDRFVSEYECVF
jgi:hypothetical protein